MNTVAKEQRLNKETRALDLSRICSIDHRFLKRECSKRIPQTAPRLEKKQSISVVKAKKVTSFCHYIQRIHLKYRQSRLAHTIYINIGPCFNSSQSPNTKSEQTFSTRS
jgi:hypothetical protein